MNTKRLSVLLAVVMLLSVVSVFASAEDSTGEALAWTTGDGYGAVVENKDGTATFTGDETLNSDNSHCGPYTKDGATAIADGDITDELDVMIDPISMEAGEKFALTVSINDAADAYKAELLVLFSATGSDSVNISIGMAPDFSASLTEAGVYTLKYRYYDNEGKLFAEFAVEKDGEAVAKAEAIDMKVNTADCGKRGYIWFSDISVDGGLRVGTPAVQDAPVLLPGDWVTGDGYGSAEKKSENLVILTGDPELNSDNSHCGPYIKNDGLIEDGTLVDELYIYLDPAELAQAEKFILTSGLNNKSDAYADEFAVMFQKDGEAIKVSAGVAPGFAGSLTEAGMYTLRYTFSLANDAVLGCFSVLKGDEEVASTGNVVMPTAAPDDTKGRRYLWFCDISVADGLAVYSDPNADYTAVDAAIAKAEALNPEDYADFSAVTAAVEAVVRGKDASEQDAVDAMAKAIEDAIAALKPAETPSAGDESSDAVSSGDESSEEPSSGVSSDASSAGDEPSDTPSTGDTASELLWGGLLLAAMAGGVLICRRAKQ